MDKSTIIKQREKFDSMYDFLRWLYEEDDAIKELKQSIKKEME